VQQQTRHPDSCKHNGGRLAKTSNTAHENDDLVPKNRQTLKAGSAVDPYQRLRETMIEAFAEVDMSGRIVDFNSLFADMLGYAPDELFSLTYQDITPARWHLMEQEILEKEVLVEGQSRIYEKEYFRKDGTLIPVELRTALLYGEDGKPSGMWAVVRNVSSRKAVRAALEESERRLHDLFEAAPYGAHQYELQSGGRLVFCGYNKAADRILGVDHSQYLGKTIEDAFPQLRETELPEAYRSVASDGKTFESVHVEYQDGLISGAYEVSAYRTAPARMAAFFRDVTERLKAEKALKAEEEKYRLLFEGLSDAVLINHISASGKAERFLDVNDEACRLLEYTRAEMLELTVPDIAAARTPEMIEAGGRRLLADGFLIWRGHVVTKSGKQIPVEVSNHLYTFRGLPTVLSLVRDVTERQHAEDALRESESKYRLLFHSINDAVFVHPLGPDGVPGRFIEVNEVACDRLGYTREELLSKTPMEIDAPDTAVLAQVKGRVLLAQGFEVWEGAHMTKDGRRIPVEISNHLFDYNGVPTVLAAVRDITERKEAEEQIKSLNTALEARVAERTAQLEAANRELEAFSYSVSHDLRAPLRAVDGFSRILMEDYAGKLDDEGREYLERICDSAGRMGQLVEDMLRLSRLTRAEVNVSRLNLSAMASEIARTLREASPDRNAEFEISPGLSAEGDPTLIRSLLENLLANAWKYTSKNESAKIEFGSSDEGDRAVFWVRDDGAGFDMAYAGNLFTAFHRLHSVEEFPGLGIGLAISQRIVQRHAGEIWAEGEVGKGATFYFTLGS
jgi:PAS domain S-box-containing protein